nr:MAG TPA: hypothetical protein [Caudoviricetes sp.]
MNRFLLIHFYTINVGSRRGSFILNRINKIFIIIHWM